jgi:hypothetical protein
MHRRVVADVVHDRAGAVCLGQVSSMAALDDVFAAMEKNKIGQSEQKEVFVRVRPHAIPGRDGAIRRGEGRLRPSCRFSPERHLGPPGAAGPFDRGLCAGSDAQAGG